MMYLTLLSVRSIAHSDTLFFQVGKFMHAHTLVPGAFVAAHLRRGHKYAAGPSRAHFAPFSLAPRPPSPDLLKLLPRVFANTRMPSLLPLQLRMCQVLS